MAISRSHREWRSCAPVIELQLDSMPAQLRVRSTVTSHGMLYFRTNPNVLAKLTTRCFIVSVGSRDTLLQLFELLFHVCPCARPQNRLHPPVPSRISTNKRPYVPDTKAVRVAVGQDK